MHYEKKPSKVADMYIEISVAPGKSGKIAFNKGDDPVVLAENFAKTFQLNRQTTFTLHKLVEDNIKAYFSVKE